MSGDRVLVVGGGVIGVCCAYFLARRGADVTLLERGELGSGASYGNAGTIAPGHPPLNGPGRVRHALRLMRDRTGPLYIPPRWDPGLARWLWSFRRRCTVEGREAAMRALAPLGRATLELFDRLVEEEELACGYRHEGYYLVTRSAHGQREAEREAAIMRRHGYRPELLSREELREREPALREDTLGGMFYPEAATCFPHRFVAEMAERARRHGARLETGRPVARLLTREDRVRGVRLEDEGGEVVEADAVVVATGAYAPALLRPLGLHLPVQAGKGYHRDLPVGLAGAPPLRIACVLSETSVFCTPMDGFVRFAGTMEFSGLNHELRRPRLEQLTTAAREYLDGVGEADPLSEWCGLRPCTPDGLPIVGPCPGYGGLLVATGHAMLGLTLAPVTGTLMADYVLDGTPSMDIGALRVDRFK
ncbi:MAG: NAD(P)/FAD-dependent oxidoreductase [Gemmatimonadota bacterium]